MSQRIQEQRPQTTTQSGEETSDGQTPEYKSDKPDVEGLKNDLDDLLDYVDSVLEENIGMEFFQSGGE